MSIFSAKYLLRFDDISPFMNWNIWNLIEELLDSNNIKPIVAIVPRCKDPNIMFTNDVDEEYFWSRVRKWEKKGWTIALHGYTHVYTTKNAGIVGLNNFSEFAGIPENEQINKIKSALDIFSSYNYQKPKVWIAPAHSFDFNTLKALRVNGFRSVSDTFTLLPYNYYGLFWVPQQLWRFRKLPFGLWTVCLHHNKWTQEDIKSLHKNIKKYNNKILDFNKIEEYYKDRKLGIGDHVFKIFYKSIYYFKNLIL